MITECDNFKAVAKVKLGKLSYAQDTSLSQYIKDEIDKVLLYLISADDGVSISNAKLFICFMETKEAEENRYYRTGKVYRWALDGGELRQLVKGEKLNDFNTVLKEEPNLYERASYTFAFYGDCVLLSYTFGPTFGKSAFYTITVDDNGMPDLIEEETEWIS